MEFVGLSYDNKINNPGYNKKDPIIPYAGNPHMYYVYYRFKPRLGEAFSLKHMHVHRCSYARLPSHINRLDFLNLNSGQKIHHFIEKHDEAIKNYFKEYTKQWFK